MFSCFSVVVGKVLMCLGVTTPAFLLCSEIGSYLICVDESLDIGCIHDRAYEVQYFDNEETRLLEGMNSCNTPKAGKIE